MGSDLITRDLIGCCYKKLGFGDSVSPATYLDKRGSYLDHRRRLNDLNSLDLRLVVGSSAAAAQPSAGYQCVCTIEKVRSALERAERESRSKGQRERGSSGSAPSPSSSSTTTSSSLSIKRCRGGEEDEQEQEQEGSESSSGAGAMMAAGCSVCMLYVLISTENPRCPRCGSHVQVPVFTSKNKKPRIDLDAVQHIL